MFVGIFYYVATRGKNTLNFTHLASDVTKNANIDVTFLQGVSIACHAEPCISYDRVVRLSVRPSVRLSRAVTESKS